MHQSLTDMTTQMSAMDKMLGLLEETNSSVREATKQVGRLEAGLNGMSDQLVCMNSQLETLPRMNDTLDKTNVELAAAVATLGPLAESLPRMHDSLDAMNQTTADMAKSLNHMPKQGILGLTAAVLLAQ